MRPRNTELEARLKGIFENLWSSFEAGRKLSSATKGSERELFIAGFLSQVFPPHYRFSGGDITDKDGHHSGQIDVVLEFPHGFSFPIYPNGPRLFLAENVAVAIEVKSNLTKQWSEVLEKAQKLESVRRCFQPQYFDELAKKILTGDAKLYSSRRAEEVAEDLQGFANVTNHARDRIPLFAVGFGGWKNIETIKEKLIPGQIDAIFVIESRCCVSQTARASGIGSLMMFLELLEQEVLRKTIRMPVLANYRVK